MNEEHRKGREPPLIDAELEVIKRRLEEGWTYRQIGAELDRDHTAVHRHARRNGWRSVRLAHGAWPRNGSAA